MNRRALLAGISTLAASRAFAQPMPLIGPVGGRTAGGGPLFSLNPGPPGKTLDLSFMTPGTLDPRMTFTRASTATYFNSAGVMQTAAVNAPRWDYNPTTHVLNGLLIEEARTNVQLNSSNLAAGTWALGNGTVIAPVVTANQSIAPDGTTTAARIVYPAVSTAPSYSVVYCQTNPTAAVYTFSMYLKGAVGGERTYIEVTDGSAVYYRSQATLTTAWQRFSLVTSALTTAVWYMSVGTDLRDGSQSATSAQTIYAWGAQLEQTAFPTSYIPTTVAAVTRSADLCSIQPANMGFYVSPGGSWMAEFISSAPQTDYQRILSAIPAPGNITPLMLFNGSQGSQYDGTIANATANSLTAAAVAKMASTWAAASGNVCLNGSAVVPSAMGAGYPLSAGGVAILPMAPSSNTQNLNGYIRRVSYWPRVLTNAEMQAVTT